MTFIPCPRESEVTRLLAQGPWPQVSTVELRAHVSQCRACGDLLLVAQLFRQARSEAASAAQISTPGALWWRAQLRRRYAAVERIGKPILGAQIFALAINLAVLVGLLASQAQQGLAWLVGLKQLPQAGAFYFKNIWSSALLDPIWSPFVLIPAVATLALLGGAVFYLAADKR